MQEKLKWTLFEERLLRKADKALRAAWGMGLRGGQLSVKAAEGVWKALVRPILEYGAEIWGENEWKEAEIIQNKMGKRILGLAPKTTNEVVIGELGWWPLKARRDMIRLRYWRKLLNMGNERLPKLIYKWEIESGNKNSWIDYTKKLIQELDLEEYWNKQDTTKSKREWDKIIENKIQEREEKSWNHRMQQKPKLRTYIKYKNTL